MSDSTPCEARRVLYRGWVQGVGFRMTARRLAQNFRVAGFVRNLADGQVELLAEGPAEEVDGFLRAVQEAMSGYIQGVDVQRVPCSGRYTAFEIVR